MQIYEVTIDRGTTEWRQNDKLHREDGPAVEHAEGNKVWYQNGKLHRIDGPAIIYSDGCKAWYINGEQLTEDEFNKQLNQAAELTVAQIEKRLGIKNLKIVK